MTYKHCWILLIVTMWCGCGGKEGPERAPAKGLVKIDGKPLATGVIRFIPTAATVGPAATASINAGAYQLPAEEGPVVGTQRVEIEAANNPGFAPDDEQAYAAKHKHGWRPPPNPVHPGYNRNSTLVVEVKPDAEQTFDFSLNAKGP